MKSKIRFFLITIIFIFLGFSLPLVYINASTIVSDNFENYSLGSVCGQPDNFWPCGSGGFIVEDTIVNHGLKAAKVFGGHADASQSAIADGSQTFSVNTESAGGYYVILREGGDLKAWLDVNADHLGKISYYDHNAGTWIDLQDNISNAWYTVQIQWRSIDHKVNYTVNGTNSSGWVDSAITSGWTGINIVQVWDAGTGNSGGYEYFDDFRENPIVIVAKNPVLIVPGLLGTEMKK